jgi:hypothetical protein
MSGDLTADAADRGSAWSARVSWAGAVVVQVIQDLLGGAGLPGVVGLDVAGAGHAAGHEHPGHQDQPAEHGDQAVPGTPPGDPLDHRPARAPVAGRPVMVIPAGAGPY